MDIRSDFSGHHLTTEEGLLLSAIQQNGLETIESIAQITALSPSRIRNVIKRLESRKVIIGKTAFLDLHTLGAHYQSVAFSLTPERHSDIKKILQYFIHHKSIIYMGAVTGEYQFYLTACGSSLNTAADILKSAAERFGNFILQKGTGTHTHFISFGRRTLTKKRISVPELSYSSAKNSIENLSDIDRDILIHITQDANVSIRTLSQRLRLPATTVHRHLTSLKSRHIWKGTVTRIDPLSIGAYQYKFLLYLKSTTTQIYERIISYCRSMPLVVRVIECYGHWDFEIDVEVTNPELLADIQVEFSLTFGDILQQIRVIQVIRHMKFIPFPDL